MTSPSRRTRPSSLAPLRITDFRRLWAASLVFNLGHLVQVVASSWVMLELTGSPLWVSLMVGAPLLPLLLLSFPAGASADLLDRRRVILASISIVVTASALMALLWATGEVTPIRLLGLGLLLGVGIAFFNPAWQAIVPSLVPLGLVPVAVSLNSASGGAAFAIGPALGGVLVAIAGPGWTFAVATLGYSAILVVVIITKTSDWRQDVGSFTAAIANGVRYLRHSPGYRALFLLGALFGFSAAAVRALLPNITDGLLGGGSTLYGVLLGAFGAGAVLGGVTRERASDLLGPRFVPASIVVYGVGGVIVGLSTMVSASMIAIFAVGITWTWVVATLNSTVQVLTPDWVRGRAMSAFVLSVFGFMPVGSALSGAVGQATSAPLSLILFSAVVALIGVGAARIPFPALDQVESPVVPRAPDPFPDGTTDPFNARVMVTTTWLVDESEEPALLDLLAQLRKIRLSTGAYHWRAYRSFDNPRRISEVFLLRSWEQHEHQQRRLDTHALAVIGRAEGFAGDGRTTVDRLVAMDIKPSPPTL